MDKEFSIAYDALKNKVFRFAIRMLQDAEDARDISQDVFEKIWNMNRQTRLSGNIEALSMIMTKNLCLDKLKHEKQKQHKLEFIRNTQEKAFHPADFDRKDTFMVIRSLIDELPEKQKMVIHLRDVEHYSFEEIAQVMEIEVSAVRMNVSRARKSVKEKLIKTMNYGLQTSR